MAYKTDDKVVITETGLNATVLGIFGPHIAVLDERLKHHTLLPEQVTMMDPASMPPPKVKRKKPLKLSSCEPEIPEKLRQKAGRDALKLCGYTVIETGQIKLQAACANCTYKFKRRILALCPMCHKTVWPTAGAANTIGTPDMWVSHERWVIPVFMPLEWKTPKTDKSEEQVTLVQKGMSQFVLDANEALRAVLAVEERLGVTPNPRVIQYLGVNSPRKYKTQAEIAKEIQDSEQTNKQTTQQTDRTAVVPTRKAPGAAKTAAPGRSAPIKHPVRG